VHERLLGYRDGERRLTNLLHLSELLHRRECEGALGMEGLMNWFGERCRDAGSDEEAELRLESDEKLVKVVTIHASKGLEYPIVFCPFLWDGPERKVLNPPLAFHDPAQDFQAVLDFGSEQLAAADGLVREEALAEDLRLAYVALTRARHRCYVIWGKCNGAAATGLGWLLHGHRNAEEPAPLARLALTFKDCDAAALTADLDALAAAAPAAVEIEPLPTPAQMHLHRHEADPPALAARRFAGELRQGWRMSSFTALAGQHAGSIIEQPDYDPEHVPPVAEPEASGIFAFPRGGRPGSCLHAIFENWDFQSRDGPGLTALVERSLARFGLSPDWTETVVHLVQQVLATPLGPHGMRLGSLSRAQRLDELEFYYPLAQLQAPSLRRVLAGHGFAAGAFNERIGRLEFAPVGGFMKGFIDLVFEQDGRFYLADYKSNWLGARPQDYAQPRLAAAMAARDYYLQYLIYAIALHRYLRLRLPGYDYERHFGGVYYLFLRGMDPARPELGVYFDRPNAELIARLDRYLATAELTERVDVD
jgi:exodeoxyribonuclease V beta subunit